MGDLGDVAARCHPTDPDVVTAGAVRGQKSDRADNAEQRLRRWGKSIYEVGGLTARRASRTVRG